MSDKTFKFVKASCLLCESVSLRSALNPNWSKWQWHCDDCGYIGDYTKEEWENMSNKKQPVNEQPKDYALYYPMENFDFSSYGVQLTPCEACSANHTLELIQNMAETQSYCECLHCGNDIGLQIVKNTSKQKQETTPIVEVHYEYCHGIYVVLALIIGGLIGFIFGVGR